MTEKVKFTQVSRVICPKTGVHYLDAIDTNGVHYTAQMETGVEKWITYKDIVKKWLPDEVEVDTEEYNAGWNECLQHLKEKLK